MKPATLFSLVSLFCLFSACSEEPSLVTVDCTTYGKESSCFLIVINPSLTDVFIQDSKNRFSGEAAALSCCSISVAEGDYKVSLMACYQDDNNCEGRELIKTLELDFKSGTSITINVHDLI